MTTHLLAKFIASAKEDGLFKALNKSALWVVEHADAIHRRRITIAKQLDTLYNSTVRYGPFNGLKLTRDHSWCSTDRGSMLLGLYEKEVLESLTNIPKQYNTFIDVGAADGYYGIGVLINNLFEHSYCYEISERGRQTIKENAILNNVLDMVEIRGIANKQFYSEIPITIIEKAVLFIDIEGAEFDLVDKATFDAFKKSIIFIELHEWLCKDGQEKRQKLCNDSVATHVATEIRMGARDLSKFAELKTFHDNDRWLICSEGRGQLMTWLRFDPK